MYGQDKVIGDGYARGAMLGGGQQSAQEARQAEIPAQAGRLDRALSVHEDTVRELLNRLETLVRPPVPEPTTAGNQIAPAPPMTAVGMQLHEFGNRLGNLTDRLQDVLRRLEV